MLQWKDKLFDSDILSGLLPLERPHKITLSRRQKLKRDQIKALLQKYIILKSWSMHIYTRGVKYHMGYKQTGLDESTFVNGGALKWQLSGGRWDDHKRAAGWLSPLLSFSFTTLQILI